MGRSIFAAVLGLGVLGAAPAEAELDDVALVNAEIQTAACARYHQLFAAYDLAFLVPELRATVLSRIADQGASEAQLSDLKRLYDDTRASAAAGGFAAGSRKAALNRGHLAILEAEAEAALTFCDRRVFALSHLRPAPKEPGVNAETMYLLSRLAKDCGFSSFFSSRYEFSELYPDFRKVTLENARRQGASDVQIHKLTEDFDEGTLSGQESWQGDNIELLELADKDGRIALERIYAESYQRCATQDVYKN